jgi:hypothetical protein
MASRGLGRCLAVEPRRRNVGFLFAVHEVHLRGCTKIVKPGWLGFSGYCSADHSGAHRKPLNWHARASTVALVALVGEVRRLVSELTTCRRRDRCRPISLTAAVRSAR